MKIRTHPEHGLSRLEVLAVIATVVLVSLFVLSMLARQPIGRAKRISCICNLKQIGLATRIYANDHEEGFPWMVSTNYNLTNTSGTMELTNSPDVFAHFKAMSNYLVTPTVLCCPSDRARSKVRDFASLRNTNVSYFVSFDSRETDPQSILSGDRNITGGLTNGFLRLIPATTQLGWTKEIHQDAGNIGLGDGSAQQVNNQRVTHQRTLITNTVIRLAIP